MITDGLIVKVEHNISSWHELSMLIEGKLEGGWIFRGVTSAEHRLIPKIGRPDSRKNPRTGLSMDLSPEGERHMMNEFRRVGRPHFGLIEDDLELLAIGQHHGLPTRLLDWSESPLVAAYFAAENAGVGATPAIYAVRGLPILKGDEDPFELADISIYRPPHISPRIPAQRAVFTVHPNPATDEELQASHVEKWTISDKTRQSFWLKRLLDSCGVNRSALFPDIDGLAMYLGWRYKWGLQ